MKIIENPRELRELSRRWRGAGEQIGFVPTMGALHEGHLALVRAARAQNTKVIASIFVNPTQFAPSDDLDKYPRPFDRDRDILAAAGCDALLMPPVQAMYGSEELDHGDHTVVEVMKVGDMWEGAVRPGHLRGVTTVVAKLFNIANPHRAYFGEKDYQQLKVIQRLVHDLFFDIEIVPIATVREADGLAMSSRNVYLNEAERRAAATLYRALCKGADAARAGHRNVSDLGSAIQAVCDSEPLIQAQYIAVVDAETLLPLDELGTAPARALIAARVGNTRLIDNIAL